VPVKVGSASVREVRRAHRTYYCLLFGQLGDVPESLCWIV